MSCKVCRKCRAGPWQSAMRCSPFATPRSRPFAPSCSEQWLLVRKQRSRREPVRLAPVAAWRLGPSRLIQQQWSGARPWSRKRKAPWTGATQRRWSSRCAPAWSSCVRPAAPRASTTRSGGSGPRKRPWLSVTRCSPFATPRSRPCAPSCSSER